MEHFVGPKVLQDAEADFGTEFEDDNDIDMNDDLIDAADVDNFEGKDAAHIDQQLFSSELIDDLI